MGIIILDTETTASEPGQICQLAYVLIDGARATGRNHFFTVDDMTPRAFGVHGLSREALAALSGGRRFADCASDIFADFDAADCLAGHGVAFDDRFLRAEFSRCGLTLGEKNLFCTRDAHVRAMRRRGVRIAWPSLTRLASHYGLDPARIASEAAALFGGGGAAHDARYDAAAVWLVMRAARAQGGLDGLPAGLDP